MQQESLSVSRGSTFTVNDSENIHTNVSLMEMMRNKLMLSRGGRQMIKQPQSYDIHEYIPKIPHHSCSTGLESLGVFQEVLEIATAS